MLVRCKEAGTYTLTSLPTDVTPMGANFTDSK